MHDFVKSTARRASRSLILPTNTMIPPLRPIDMTCPNISLNESTEAPKSPLLLGHMYTIKLVLVLLRN